ncbi:MAG TPA: DNA-directed RNA polymerase subunit P [Methanoregulaceae archaeon]|nr:MAG: DNA-directed RNA polymerase subunit P [Methanolinea sp.]HON82333.1 DNA-directed RNA polymerase subunit P [Methanoregulaceae archaeon]HPD11128.1 DNA-directed RNA polymerase subunit P [Methanoregulaceae archaeon]HRT16166.1 DNA-directed RNA polymerase subunit P [Methanoregulaceae archaeon]HRU31715.1 DNA-directed RNA polymerase subunit P [Methanoregulaceae archaeon]
MAGSYKCARCKSRVEIDVNVRCPYCGHRILFKERGAAIKELRAR